MARTIADLAGEENVQEAHLAEQALQRPWPSEVLEAERLALLGFLRARRGDLLGYRALALEAARKAQTSLTLYHLGLALSPRDGLLALQEAFRLYQGDPGAEGRLALALARVLRRLGRLEEALGYASLAVLRSPAHPFYRLEEICLELLAGDTPLVVLEARLVPFLAHEAGGVRLYARSLSLWLRRMRQEPASDLLPVLLAQVRAPNLVYHLPWALLIYRQEGRVEEASRLLRAAQAATPKAPWANALLRLSEGLLRYPQEEAGALLEGALPGLEEEGFAEEALLARAHLFGLKPTSDLPPGLDTLRQEARSLFLPEGLAFPRPRLYFRALGGGGLVGGPRLGLRALELLALLLAQEAWEGPALARALYGEEGGSALKVEVHRLRKAGLPVASRPYQLLIPLQSDFLELKGAIRAAALDRALALYRGPLLPRSAAPGIEELRVELEEALRRAVLVSKNPESLQALAKGMPEDLEVWEALLENLSPTDPRYPAVSVRVRRLREEYGL